jgi:hypothetical protein
MNKLSMRFLLAAIILSCQLAIAENTQTIGTMVSGQRATISSIEHIYHGVGFIKPKDIFEVASLYGGRLVALMVEEGDHVLKNQIVARLRLKEDESQGTKINGEIQGYPVVSENAGVVIKKLQSFGNIVATGTPIVTIATLDSPRIVINIPLGYVKYIGYDSQVRFKYNTLEIVKPIVKISTYGNGSLGMFPVEISADNLPATFGEFLNIDVVLQKQSKHIVIPRSAIIENEGLTSVFVSEAGTVVEKLVITGIETRNKVEIIAGIDLGELVITKGNYDLVSGTKVSVNVNE